MASREPLIMLGVTFTADSNGNYLFPTYSSTNIVSTETLTSGASFVYYPAVTIAAYGTLVSLDSSTTTLPSPGAPIVVYDSTYLADSSGAYSIAISSSLVPGSGTYSAPVTFFPPITVALAPGGSAIIMNGKTTALPPLPEALKSESDSQSSPASVTSVPTSTEASGGYTTLSSPSSSATSSLNANSTASSTSSASPSTGVHKAAHKYSSGEIAGAAVGTGVGAAIIAFLLAFFLLRCRGRSNLHRSHSLARASPDPPPPFVEKSSASKAPQIVDIMSSAGDSSSWTEHLPQPVDDETMRRTIKTLYDQIQLHVENFYYDVAVPQVSEIAQTELYRLDSELVHPSLYKLMLKVKAKTVLIKHSLAHIIFASIDHNEPGNTGHTSFLPQEFVGLLAIRGLEQRRNKAPSFRPATSQALSQYRVLTSYLRPNPATDRVYLQQRDSTINTEATSFVKAFGPWANHSQSERARFDNLVEIMRSTAEVGIVVFSQPAAYEYQWRDDDGNGHASGGNNVVMLPAFVKVTDDVGNKLERPYVVVRASSAAV